MGREKTLRIIISFLLISFLPFGIPSSLCSASDGPIQWSYLYGGTGSDEPHSLIQASDGGYLLAGTTTSFGLPAAAAFLVKTDSTGSRKWSSAGYGHGSQCGAYSVIQTSDGGYAFAGYTTYSTAGGKDAWLVKTNSSGTRLWEKTYGGLGDDYAYTLVQTSDGGYTLAGYTNSSGAGNADFWLVKTDANGNKLWEKTYGGLGDDFAYSMVQTSDGGYALAGCQAYGAYDIWLVKTDSNGNQAWSKTFGGGLSEVAFAAIQTNDGGYALAGRTESYGAGSSDCWLVKTNDAGNTLWSKTYGGTSYEQANSLVQTSDGGYALAGVTGSYGAGGGDSWLVKTDSTGNNLWTNTYGGAASDEAFCVIQTSDGGYALASRSASYGSGNYDFWLVKVPSATGQPTASAAPANLTVNVGQSATFSVTASAGTPPYSYQWFEGSSPLSGQTSTQLTITKNAAGSFSYYCRVTDSAAKTANSNTVALTVNPGASTLTASISPPSLTVTAGQPATFSATASGGTTPYSFQWYEGTAPISGATSTQYTVTKNSAGTYSFYCRITDSATRSANSNSATLTVNPSGNPQNATPTASFTCSPSTQEIGKAMNFDASASTSSGATITSYQWDFGDGNTGSGKTVSHSYTSQATFTARLTVTDSNGQTGTTTKQIIIAASNSNGFSIPVAAYVAVAAVAIGAIAAVLAFRIVKKKKTPPSQVQFPRAD